MVQVEGRDRRQSEMNDQCEQIISTHTPSTKHTCKHSFCDHSQICEVTKCMYSYIEKGAYF